MDTLIPTQVLTSILRSLDKMEVLMFNEPKSGPQLFFHHYRVDSKHLLINTERINALKQAHEQRTKAIIEYITNTDKCRTKLLLQYFGEDKTDDCGHCDYCSKQYLRTAVNVQDIVALFNDADELTINEITQRFPNTQPQEISNIIRTLVDEQVLGIKHNNVIYKLNS